MPEAQVPSSHPSEGLITNPTLSRGHFQQLTLGTR